MSKGRVRFILPSLAVGGAERVCLDLAGGLISKGHYVDFILFSSTVKFDLPKGVVVKPLNINNSAPIALRVVRALIGLIKEFQKNEQDDIYIVSVRGAVLLSLFAVFFSRKKPCLIIREAALYRRKIWYPPIAHRIALKFLYPLATGTVAVSSNLKEELIDRYGYKEPVEVINNPTDIDRIGALSVAAQKRSRFKITFLAVGRLVEEKGYDILLRAFASMENNEHCGLYVVGSGPLEGQLRRLCRSLMIEDRVVWVGQEENPYPWFRIADVFVLASLTEGFNNAVAEAVVLNVPKIIATRCGGGPEELLSEFSDDRMVLPGDIFGLAKAMADSVRDGANVPARNSPLSISEAVDRYLRLASAHGSFGQKNGCVD